MLKSNLSVLGYPKTEKEVTEFFTLLTGFIGNPNLSYNEKDLIFLTDVIQSLKTEDDVIKIWTLVSQKNFSFHCQIHFKVVDIILEILTTKKLELSPTPTTLSYVQRLGTLST